LILLFLGLNQWQNIGWRSPSIHWLFAGFLFLGTLFLVTETKSENPIIQLSFFRHRIFGFGNLNVFLVYLSHLSVIFLMPFYLTQVLELSPSQMGWVLITVPLCLSVVAPFSGWLSDKIGTRFLTTLGLLLAGLSILSIVQLDLNSNYQDVVLRLIVLGVGVGMFSSPNNSSIMGSVSKENYGRAAGILATMRNLGMVMGVSLTSVIFTSSENRYLSQLQSQILENSLLSKIAFTQAFHNVYMVTGIICLVAAFSSYLRGESKTKYNVILQD
jgi:MFS family permease